MLDIQISRAGLLNGVNSKTISKVNETFKNIARSVGAISATALFNSDSSSDGVDCSKEGEYVYIHKIEDAKKVMEKEKEDLKQVMENQTGDDKEESKKTLKKIEENLASERYIHKICSDQLVVTTQKYEDWTNLKNITHTPNELDTLSGIYFRQDFPYLITVKGKITAGTSTGIETKTETETVTKEGDDTTVTVTVTRTQTVNTPADQIVTNINNDKIVYSPSESPTYYLPISRTLFADNEATITLDHGVVTQYKQDNKSELENLASLPADLLEGYFSAIGSIFSKISDSSTKEFTIADNSMKLELAKLKHKLCLIAMRDDDEETVTSLKCSE